LVYRANGKEKNPVVAVRVLMCRWAALRRPLSGDKLICGPECDHPMT